MTQKSGFENGIFKYFRDCHIAVNFFAVKGKEDILFTQTVLAGPDAAPGKDYAYAIQLVAPSCGKSRKIELRVGKPAGLADSKSYI